MIHRARIDLRALREGSGSAPKPSVVAPLRAEVGKQVPLPGREVPRWSTGVAAPERGRAAAPSSRRASSWLTRLFRRSAS